MKPQSAVTVFAKVLPDRQESLCETLAHINADVESNDLIPFGKIRFLHFARFVVLDAVADSKGAGIAPGLLFIANIDISPAEFMRHFVEQVGPGIDAVFAACVDYPPQDGRNLETRLNYLTSRLIPTNAFYVNTIGRPVERIRQESTLREAIERFLDRRDWAGCSGSKVRSAVRAYVFNEPSLTWAKSPAEKLPLSFRLLEKGRFVLLTVLGAILAVLLLPLILLWVLILRAKEKSDPSDSLRPDQGRLNLLRSFEDTGAQNQFTAVGFVKLGLVRNLTVRIVLALAQIALRHVFNRGNLAGIKLLGLDGVDTIHFARWVRIDEGRRLLFASNYDGSLESYMGDFVDKVAWGLNLVFNNGRGYPRTRWFVFEGARDEQAFKDYIRNRQLITQVWHTPYRNLTAVHIANNEAIRAGLYGDMVEAEALAWLRRF